MRHSADSHMVETSHLPQVSARPPWRRRRNLVLPTLTLALRRLRQTWRMLLLTGLGTVAAVMLLCAVPLFSEIALSAGLRGTLAGDPGASQLVVQTNTELTSAAEVAKAQQQIDQLVHRDMGIYVPQSSRFSVTLNELNIVSLYRKGQSSSSYPLQIVGIDNDELSEHVSVLRGTAPRDNPHALEIMLTQNMADSLNAKIGTVFTVDLPEFGGQGALVPLLVTGIYATRESNDPLFSCNVFYCGFGEFSGVQGQPVVTGPGGGLPVLVKAVASNQAILSIVSRLQTRNAATGHAFPGSSPFNWYYTIDLSHVTVNNIGDLSQRLYTLLNNLQGLPGYAPDRPPTSLQNDLSQFQAQSIIAQVPVVLLLLQVFGLILLFISLMINLLVERQAEAIAVLRSRGAPRGLIFRSMTVQTVCVCLLALIVGPLLALLPVDFIAGRALGNEQHGALQIVLGQPVAAAWGLRWYALAAVICAFVAMVVSTYQAANRNILALRRDSARGTRPPFWQRLNLDIVFAVIALVGYSLYAYALNQVPATVQLMLSPLALVAPIFLLLAAALLFLRFFPSLLNLAARLAARSRSAAPVLAISQMARSPRQASRMILLLALSTAFALFTLIFSATQYQRTLDVSAFAVGADFTGQLKLSTESPAYISTRYQHIRGVLSTTSAYVDQFSDTTATSALDMYIVAVDTGTYAQTVIWPDQGVSPSVLARRLAAQRRAATGADVVPAVIDQALANDLQLRAGSRFIAQPSGYGINEEMHFVVMAVVTNIPTLYDDPDVADNGSSNGGLLVDYQTFATVYHLDTGNAAPALNTVWLRTRSDNASLASVRTALSKGALAVDQLRDRRQLIAQAEANPLIVDLFGTLELGAATALFLALLGVLLASWLGARNRLTSFAMLRALGGEPRQLTRVLLVEQGIIYALSIAVGVAVGIVLSILVLPVLVIANGIASPSTFNPSDLDVPPVHAVYPLPLLGLALGVLAGICLISLALMTAVVARASIGKTLRLNED